MFSNPYLQAKTGAPSGPNMTRQAAAGKGPSLLLLKGICSAQGVALGQQTQQDGNEKVPSLMTGHPFAVGAIYCSANGVNQEPFIGTTIGHLKKRVQGSLLLPAACARQVK